MEDNKCCCSTQKNDFYKLDAILEKYQGKESDLIPILQNIQDSFGYLPQDIIEMLCSRTGMHPSQVMGVITFYSQFRLKPVGEKLIKICFGTACHVNGAETIAEALMDELGIDIGGTTDDGRFTLEAVACLGCCSLAPVMMIGEDTYGRLTPDMARKIIKSFYADRGEYVGKQ